MRIRLGSRLVLRYDTAAALAIVAIWILVGLFATWLAPKNPYQGSLRDSLLPPFFLPGGSGAFPLGTDLQGHDIFSQMLVGARLTLLVAGCSLLIGGGLGTAIGLIAGYYGGWIDDLLMRLADFMFAVPVVLLALIAAVTIGPSFQLVIGIISLLLWSRFARLIRAEVLALRGRDFVALAHVAGASDWRIITRHLAPNVASSAIVMASLQAGQAILTEASLSFLGVGVPAPNPSWGAMISIGRNYLDSAWWIALFPGLAILLVLVALNAAGDWLRDYLDPGLVEV